jgi:hypothetical protein
MLYGDLLGIIDFINKNRQTGTTTALVRTIDSYGGYLIVGSEYEAGRIVEQYPYLKDKVFSVRQIKGEACRGLPSGRLFFDTTAISEIMNHQEELVKITREALDELSYEGIGGKLDVKFNQWSKE